MNPLLTLSTARTFAVRYRQERERHGDALPRLILTAHRQQRGPLCDWITPLSPAALSAALEAVLEQRQPGVYATSADVAVHMADSTILPCLLAGRAASTDQLADLIADNRDLRTLTLDWLASASTRQVRDLLARLETLTVLDPTCGTGALLLAALRVLTWLRRACLARLDRSGEQVGDIVARNLFGVDLLPEAVELCRARLQLEAGTDGPDNLTVGNVLLAAPTRQFDVVLGNPPYLELREVAYIPQGFRCQEAGAVHALCVENGLKQLRPDGWISMLVPMSLVSTQRMKPVQELLEEGRHVWYANYSWRPARLFPSVNRAITLFLATASQRPRTWTTGYQKWRTRERAHLFERLQFVESPRHRSAYWVPKLTTESERPLLERFLRIPTTVADFLSADDDPARRIYYRTDGGLYWKVFTDFEPAFSCDGQAGKSTRQTSITAAQAAHVVPLIAALSSDLFWWWYTLTSNCRHLNPIDVHSFPLPASALDDPQLARLGRAYLRDIVRHSSSRPRRQRQTGHTLTQTFRIRHSRPLLLRIGAALAPHYGLSEQDSTFLANYDLDFRLERK